MFELFEVKVSYLHNLLRLSEFRLLIFQVHIYSLSFHSIIFLGCFCSFLDVLHKGDLTTVYLAKRKKSEDDDHERYAIKVVSKLDAVQASMAKRISLERKIMTKASRYPDYFCRLRCSFTTNEHLFIVMDYEPVGDCLHLLEHLQYVSNYIIVAAG